MSTFKRCDESVEKMAKNVIKECNTALEKVRIDFVFAFGDRDEITCELTSDALKLHGVRALGITKKVSLKERALGRADAEISIDGDWWDKANDGERQALLDHELFHLVPTGEMDDLGRPLLKLRPHDYEFGWFKAVAQRRGASSLECIAAKRMMDDSGQYFWPELFSRATGATNRMHVLELDK
jgi:hypothetical protein